MAFDDLHPLSREYIEALAGNLDAGTHANTVIRYSGSGEDPRSRIVQPATGGGDDFTLFMEGYSAGDAFQRLVARGYLKGSWVSPDTWEGTIEDSALTDFRGS
jgi:hypothetical protein